MPVNDKRRGRLRNALRTLELVRSAVESAADEEKDGVDNCPENLQGSDRFERMEEAADHLEDAVGSLDEAADHIREAIER